MTTTTALPVTCTCRGYDPADPCGHGDVADGCPACAPETIDECLECSEPLGIDEGGAEEVLYCGPCRRALLAEDLADAEFYAHGGPGDLFRGFFQHEDGLV